MSYIEYAESCVQTPKDEIERLRRVERAAKDVFEYFTKYPALLPQEKYDALLAALHNQGSMDGAIDTLSDSLQEGK